MPPKKQYVAEVIHETMLEKIMEGIKLAKIDVKLHNYHKYYMLQPLEKYLKRKGIAIKYEDG